MRRYGIVILTFFMALTLRAQNYDCYRGSITPGAQISGTAPGGFASCNAATSDYHVIVWQFYSVSAQAGHPLTVTFTVTGTEIGTAAFYTDMTMNYRPLASRVADCRRSCTLVYTPTLSTTYYFQIGGLVEGPIAYTFTLNAPTPGQMPNLTPYKPESWSDALVVTDQPGSTVDGSSLTPSDQLFVSWAVVNDGNAPAAAGSRTDLYLDGEVKQSWTLTQELSPLYYATVQDFAIGALPAGMHTLRLKVDPTNVVPETNEGDNEFTKSFRVGNGGRASCAPGTTNLCLNGARFRVEVAWQTSDGRSGQGQAVGLTDDTGYFWFFNYENLELCVKVLDGRGINNHFWVFYGALSNVSYKITVTDTQSENAVQKIYDNREGTMASVADTSAF